MGFFVFSSPEYSYYILQGLPMPFEYFRKKRTQTDHWRNKRHLAALKRKVGVCCIFSRPFLDLEFDLICFPVMWVATECGKKYLQIAGRIQRICLYQKRNKATASYCKQKFYIFLTYCKQWSWFNAFIRILSK